MFNTGKATGVFSHRPPLQTPCCQHLAMYTQHSYFKFLHPKNNLIPKLVLWLQQFRGEITYTQSSLSSSYSGNQKSVKSENQLLHGWFWGHRNTLLQMGHGKRQKVGPRMQGPGSSTGHLLPAGQICCQHRYGVKS